jgi:hypothetical protein
MVSHIGDVGDVIGRLDAWIGAPGSRTTIEGFAIYLTDVLQPDEIKYRAVLEGWYTPWIKGGTRNWFLPLFGLAVRLCGAAAGRYICLYPATFTDGTMQEGSGGTACVSDSFAPMEVFRVLLELLTAVN